MTWLGRSPPCTCNAQAGICISDQCSLIGCCQTFKSEGAKPCAMIATASTPPSSIASLSPGQSRPSSRKGAKPCAMSSPITSSSRVPSSSIVGKGAKPCTAINAKCFPSMVLPAMKQAAQTAATPATTPKTKRGSKPANALNAAARSMPMIHAVQPTSHSSTKQTTRLLKVKCESCGYTARVTRKWLDQCSPICPCNHKPMKETLNEQPR